MARYGPDDVAVTYNSQALADVTVISDATTEALLQEITPFGSAWETHAAVGVSRMGEITLEAPYADDSNLLMDEVQTVGIGGTSTLALTFGGSNTLSVSTIVKSISRVMARGSLTVFRAVLQPTGTVTLGP